MKSVSEIARALLENDRVRVVELRMKPGEKLPMHSHPSYLVYSFAPGRFLFTTPDGRSELVEYEAGQVSWRDPETHEVENVGTTEGHVLVIDLK